MKIKEFIQQEIFIPRLKQRGILVIYDPTQRYRVLCQELATEKCRVIDTSTSSILSRASALETLQKFGQPNPAIEGILVYVPARPPVSDDEKQRDPFAIYIACGSVFPEGDGDEYQSLCLRARADYATEIRRIFRDNPNPSFDVIDAVGGGGGWPNFQALFKVESARDILFTLLVPTETQREALKNQDGWLSESASLLQSTLGLHLKTKIKTWTAIAEELWRFLLFSEFAFDLPTDLPDALANIPRAPQEARLLLEDLCERLRNDRRTQASYIERAEGIEQELNLREICQKIEDFGIKDTFPFEERASFNQAVDALKRDNVEKLRQIIKRHSQTVWVGRGENQTQWNLLQAASNLVQACDYAENQLSDRSRNLETLVDYYTANMREVDRLQREFEQAVGDSVGIEGDADWVIRQARVTYRKLIDKLQTVFIRHLEKSGWPVAGKLSIADVFDRLVAPKLLESGRKVVFFMIDALRYELGAELSKQLSEAGQIELHAVCACFPTITPVGMASLLPGAGQSMRLSQKDGKVSTLWDGQPLVTVTQRMDILRNRYGQRFLEIDLAKFAREIPKIDNAVELLVIRSNEMDENFESNPEAAPGLISRTFQRIRSTIHKLAGLGFQEAIIATDHGFFLNTSIEAGDVCSKPAGNWLGVHERMLLGDGSSDSFNLVMSTAALGMNSDFSQAAFPRALVAYRSGMMYFHGGPSLQEAIVPVISIRLRAPEKKVENKLSVMLNYKRGGNKITTRLPVFEISLAGQSGLFAGEESLELLLEAHDPKGQVVGEAKPGGSVNPATRVITIKPGETLSITIKMDLEFEGKFYIKALAPSTLAGLGKSLELETDYTV